MEQDTAPTTQPSPESITAIAPRAPRSMNERMESARKAMASLNEPPAPPTPEPEAAPAPTTEAAPKSNEELRQAKLLRDLQKKEAAALRERKAREETAKRVAELEEQLKDPLKAIGGPEGYRKLTEELVGGKVNIKSPEQEAIEATRAELEQLKAFKESIEREKREAEQRRVVEEELGIVRQHIETAADDFPLVSSLPWTANKVRDAYYAAVEEAGEDADPPDISEVMSNIEEAVRADVRTVMSSDRAVKFLLQDPEIKARVLAALGMEKAPAKAEEPKRPTSSLARAIPKRAEAEVPARGPRPRNERERMKSAESALQRLLEAGEIE